MVNFRLYGYGWVVKGREERIYLEILEDVYYGLVKFFVKDFFRFYFLYGVGRGESLGFRFYL